MRLERVAVLASGGGSNLQALLDHLRDLGDRRASDVALVASERSGAGAISRARAAGIDTAVFSSRFDATGRDLLDVLRDCAIDSVVLAGFLQLIPADVIAAFPDRILNVHPAPLPYFGGKGMYGSRVHTAVLDAGATFSGPTVHLIDEEYDRGPIIAHWPVPVLNGDDARSLADRVLRAEHLLYPRVIESLAHGAKLRRIILPAFDVTANELALARVVDTALAQVPNDLL